MIRAFALLVAFAGSLAFADTVNFEHDFSCTGGELKMDFALQEGSFTLPDGTTDFEKLTATSTDSDLKILGCAYITTDHEKMLVPHCAAEKGILRYDIYPAQTDDAQIQGAAVIVWTETEQVLEHVPLSCTQTK